MKMNFDYNTSLQLLETDGHLMISEPRWHEHMEDMLWTMFGGDGSHNSNDDEDNVHTEETGSVDNLRECIQLSIAQFVGGLIPERSMAWYSAVSTPSMIAHAQKLVDAYSGEQRSDEWFQRRHNMITASNAWKIIGSEASRRSLIWEKINPPRSVRSENVDGATHWGERYEDVAVAVYEKEYGNTVSLVGCIPHPELDFIGASPDGIVVQAGRGLEIKCVVSRELTGVPTKAYWVQMQWQAEVMGLNEIDFLECRFSEYESREEAAADGSFSHTMLGQLKGTMHQFHGTSGTYYVHAPLEMHEEDYERWSNEVIAENEGATWVCSRWWKLEEKSCVTVPRHRGWFNSILPLAKALWSEVQNARAHGGEEYRPAPRQRAPTNNAELTVETIPLCVYSDEE